MTKNRAPTTSPHALPVAVIDAGSLLCLSAIEHQQQTEALHLLDHMMEKGECTLLIPRCAVQEMLSGMVTEGKREIIQEIGPTSASGKSIQGYAAHLPSVPLFRHPERRNLYNWLEDHAFTALGDNTPGLRYYPSPKALIENGELTGRKGGIVIFDTDTERRYSPLNEKGYYSRGNGGSQRGDNQIMELYEMVRSRMSDQSFFPVISEDYAFLNTHIDRQLDRKMHPNMPFPLPLRALFQAYETQGIIQPKERQKLFDAVYKVEDSKGHHSDFVEDRNRRAHAGAQWLHTLQQPASHIDTTSATIGTVNPAIASAGLGK